MDPLSIATSVVGLIGVAAQSSYVLQNLISRGKEAPRSLRNLKGDVDAIRLALVQLQLYLTRKLEASPSRAALILIEQVVTILSGCVITFSGMEAALKSFDSDSKMGLMDRVRWVSKADTISEILARIQDHKTSLILMLTILESQSQLEATSAMDELCKKVDPLLSDNKILKERMLNWEPEELMQKFESASKAGDNEHATDQELGQISTAVRYNELEFAFEEELESSWVYKRAAQRGETASISGRTASWSMLSGLSLSQLSRVSVIALPIYEDDISNWARYKFGTPSEELHTGGLHLQPPLSPDNQARNSPLSSLRARLLRQTTPLAQEIFAVPLDVSIRYASVIITRTDQKGVKFIYGYIPIVVAKTCAFLAKNGLDVQHIFQQSGSVQRVAELQAVFNRGPLFGKRAEWTGYTVHDVASCLLRYLKTLPEPLIPWSNFWDFCPTDDSIFVEKCFFLVSETDDSSDDFRSATETVIPALQRSFRDLPPVNRQLLVHLLDLLAGFASRSDINLMTPVRLMSAFQPSILSPKPDDASRGAQDHANAVCVIMIQHQRNFMMRI